MLILLSLLLFGANHSYATTLDELETRQIHLAHEHELLLRELPESFDLAQSINAQTTPNQITKIREFFKKYDDFNLDKIDYFQDHAVERARLEASEYLRSHKKLTKKMAKALRDLEESRATYIERKPFFRTERDTERLDIGQEVLHHYGNFAKEIRKSRGEKVTRVFGSAKIVPFVDSPGDFIKVADRFVMLLWNAYFRTRTGKADYAPIPEALQSTQRRLVKMRHIDVAWDGLENLESVEHDGKTLNMFLINHANSFLDTSAQQAFPVKGMSAMGNVDVFFPAFLAKRMVKSDHMITVGHGDTTGKAIELVKNKKLNKFFLAIEGITGTGLYEMRPIMPLFNEAVYDAINRGLELKLYPVAFPDNFRLLNDWRDPIEGKKTARGVLLKPFTTEHCRNLLAATNDISSISEVVRWAWFSTLNTNESEWLSMPYPSIIETRLNQMIWGEK